MKILNLIRDQYLNDLEEACIDCSGCSGICCKLPWRIEITSEEASRLDYNIDTYNYNGIYYLNRKNDGTCVYQDQSGLCSIHESRPKVCRSFDCRNDSRMCGLGKYS